MAAPCRRCETAFFLSALSGGASFYLAFVFRQICVYRLVNFERFSWISDREREGAATLLSAGRSRQLPSSASPQAVPSPPLPRCGTGDGLGCHTRTSVVAFCACGEAWSLPQLHVPNLFSFTCSVSVLRSTHLYFTVSWLAGGWSLWCVILAHGKLCAISGGNRAPLAAAMPSHHHLIDTPAPKHPSLNATI